VSIARLFSSLILHICIQVKEGTNQRALNDTLSVLDCRRRLVFVAMQLRGKVYHVVLHGSAGIMKSFLSCHKRLFVSSSG
jgi:hypothetical protein